MSYFHFNCDERVNLFVGPNATGKSAILRALCELYTEGENDALTSFSFDFRNPRGEKGSFNLEASEDWPRRESVENPNDIDAIIWKEVPLLYIPATRINFGSKDVFNRDGYDSRDDVTDVPFKDLFNTGKGIFYGSYVQDAIDRAREQGITNSLASRQLRLAIEIGYSCARVICREIVFDDAPHIFVENDTESEGGRISHYGMGIVTSDNILGEPLHVRALSSGTQGTLLWVLALALRIANHYRWQEGWQEKPAILLIDEIENHLHPTWQRRVIPALLEHFPGLQIFATTHSPFVVAGLKAGQVHLLNRDANGMVTATTNTEDIIGWTADQILRTMMGVDEPTDQATADRLNRLRQLRGKEILTPEEESELNKLRRQESADLLSKGDSPLLSENDPLLKAQRERYSDLMQRFLLSRQSDLSQDGA